MTVASTTSQKSEGTFFNPRFKQLNDAVYEVYKPATGPIDLEIVFFHGFPREVEEDPYIYFRTWMTADDCECWLQTWLPQHFPQAHIYVVYYYTGGIMDMYLVGENLVQCLVNLEKVGERCPVVFVGHSIGGIVLKEVCIRASEKGTSGQDPGMNKHKTFLSHMRGAFFFSTPHSGTQSGDKLGHGGRLRDNLNIFSERTARINGEFAKLRRYHQWKLFGVSEGHGTKSENALVPLNDLTSRLGWTSWSSRNVEEASARSDMDSFLIVEGEDHYSICKPKDQRATSFQFLLKFLETIGGDEEVGLQSLLANLQLPRMFTKLNSRVEFVILNLQLDRAEPSLFALVGMSGIGKTTLAKELLLKIRKEFDYVCFIEDASLMLTWRKLEDLVASNLFYGKRGRPWLQKGKQQSVWSAMRGTRSLVIIDDVDSEAEKHINFLLTPGWIANGSRLIITSRTERQGFMSGFFIHKMQFLPADEALALFTAHVESDVKQVIPKDLMTEVVDKCDGLPLTLEVMGSYLGRNKIVDIWRGALESLRKAESVDGSCINKDTLWKKLRVSFEKLGDAEKNIFLDLAMFDTSDPERMTYDVSILTEAWSSEKRAQGTSTGLIDSISNMEECKRASVKLCLKNLEDRCFISMCFRYQLPNGAVIAVETVLEQFIGIRINDQLRDMGKNESRSPCQDEKLWRRIWHPNDVEQLLTQYKGNEAQAEVVSVGSWRRTTDRVESLQMEFDWSYIGRLKKLRFLRMYNVRLLGQTNLRFSPNVTLVHLIKCSRAKSWGYPFESKSWPIRRQDVGRLHQLAVLLLDSCISLHLPKNFHELTNLRILRIHGGNLTELPKTFGLLPNLRRLSLRCPKVQTLPDTFNELSALLTLDLTSCSNLRAWPVHISRQPPRMRWHPLCNLQRLIMDDLPHLTELPDVFGQMCSLETLKLVKCHALTQLPEGFGELHRLRHLRVEECDGLEYFCQSFGDLTSLEVLYVDKCERLHCLPDSLGDLDSLTRLDVSRTSLTSLPESIGKLKRLTSLRVNSCENFHHLPETLRDVPNLHKMQVTYCKNLPNIPSCGYQGTVVGSGPGDLPGPKSLIDNMRQYEGLLPVKIGRSTIGQCTNLGIIDDCENLQNLPESFGQFEVVTTVNMDSCSKLKMRPESMGQFQRLYELDLQGCSKLESLPESLVQLHALSKLNLRGCIQLGLLPESIGQLHALTTLNLQGCNKLERLPESIGQLHALSKLDLQDCSNLESLQESIGQLHALYWLDLQGCSKLEGLPESMRYLQELSRIDLRDCSKLERLPESIGQLQALSWIDLRDCSKLETLPESMGQLQALSYLDLEGCSELARLPESIGQLQTLFLFDIRDCNKLERLPESMEHLYALSQLPLEGCTNQERLPQFEEQLKELSYLDLKDCSKVERLWKSIK